MFTIGSWIYQGRAGLEKDLPESFKWQKLAADVGHPGALFNIGDRYLLSASLWMTNITYNNHNVMYTTILSRSLMTLNRQDTMYCNEPLEC